MKRSFVLGIALCLAGAACADEEPAAVESPAAVAASPSPSPSPTLTAPVQLEGQVNNLGMKDFTGVGTNIAVEFQLTDFAFNPTFIKVAPGSTVQFSLDNMGQRGHTFTIDALRIDHELAAGGQQEGQFQLPDSGVVPFYCRFHVGQGMQGAFYFQEGDSALAAVPADSPEVQGSGTRSTGGTRRSATSVRRTTGSNQGPATSGTAQNREGDLVVPDVQIDGVQQGGSTAAKAPAPLDKAGASTSQSGQPKPQTSPKASKSGSGGAAGQASEPGSSGESGDEGSEGESGEPGETSTDDD